MIKPLQSITLKNDNGEDTTYVVASAPAIVETTEPASVASFSDGAEGIPVSSLIADINPVQTGSGDPSPSNVRPITGWTGMNIVRTGKNLIPNKKVKYSTHTWLGTDNSSTLYYLYLPAGTYTLSATLTSASTLWMRRKSGTANERIGAPTSSTTPSGSFTVTSGDYYRFWVYNVDPTDVISFQLEVGSTATTYEPYTGTTYLISWADEAGTVYGGTLDVTTGLLTVDMEIVDLGTLNWTYYTSGTNPLFSTSSITDSALGVNGVVPNAISSAYTAYVSNSRSNLASVLPNGCFSIERGTTIFHVRNDTYTSAAAFKTAMSGVQLVYELDTPQTYQLTPQAVLTILGQNNIWADTGDVEVAYCADTKMYIDKMISEL